MATPLDIQQAMCRVILPLRRDDDSFIVQQTTLDAPAAPGDIDITLASLAPDGHKWTYSQAVSFDDTAGEERLYVVESGWDGTNPLQLDFTGRGFTGLQYAHESGTTVYSNLFDFAPLQTAPGLANGNPVIFVHARVAPWRPRAMARTASPTITVMLQYLRLLTAPSTQPSGERIHPNAWAEKQQKATHEDMWQINRALLFNEELIGPDTKALALQLSPLDSQGNKTQISYEPIPTINDTWQYVATLVAIYEGNFENFMS